MNADNDEDAGGNAMDIGSVGSLEPAPDDFVSMMILQQIKTAGLPQVGIRFILASTDYQRITQRPLEAPHPGIRS